MPVKKSLKKPAKKATSKKPTWVPVVKNAFVLLSRKKRTSEQIYVEVKAKIKRGEYWSTFAEVPEEEGQFIYRVEKWLDGSGTNIQRVGLCKYSEKYGQLAKFSYPGIAFPLEA